MVKLWALLVGTIPIVYALPQSGLPPATSPADVTLVASISSAVASASLKPYATPLSTDEIKEWDALGDSFTAGTGSNGGEDFQGYSQDCSRYNKAYPMQMNADTRWPGDPADRKLNFGACTGNKIVDLTNNQVCLQLLTDFTSPLMRPCGSSLTIRPWTIRTLESLRLPF